MNTDITAKSFLITGPAEHCKTEPGFIQPIALTLADDRVVPHEIYARRKKDLPARAESLTAHIAKGTIVFSLSGDGKSVAWTTTRYCT